MEKLIFWARLVTVLSLFLVSVITSPEEYVQGKDYTCEGNDIVKIHDGCNESRCPCNSTVCNGTGIACPPSPYLKDGYELTKIGREKCCNGNITAAPEVKGSVVPNATITTERPAIIAPNKQEHPSGGQIFVKDD